MKSRVYSLRATTRQASTVKTMTVSYIDFCEACPENSMIGNV